MKRLSMMAWKAVLVGGVALVLAFGGWESLLALGTSQKREAEQVGSAASSGTMALAQATQTGQASLRGKVTFPKTPPKPEKILMSADPVCMQQHPHDVFQEDIVVSNDGGLKNALVYIKDGITGTYPAPKQSVVLNQEGCIYHPHVFGIQVGQPLEIINSDPALHNVNCQPKLNKRFNIAQPQKGMKTTKTFDQMEVGIPFRCNVHPWMAAYAGVFPHPFWAVTDENGAFSIQGLPAGSYTIEVWHEKLGTKTQTITLADGETKEISFSF
jgi:hypothetical protein